MALPATNPTLAPRQAVPDSVVVNIQIAAPANATPSTLMRYLNPHALARWVPEDEDETLFLNGVRDFGLSFWVSRRYPSAPLNVRLTVNPLRQRHRRPGHRRSEQERGTAGTTNWLHADDVHLDNRHVWIATQHLIDGAFISVLPIFRCIARREGWHQEPVIVATSFASIEVAVDFRAADPGALIAAIAPGFNAFFRRVTIRDYDNAARRRASREATLQDEARSIAADRAKGERYKLYEKTNIRVRLEAQFHPEAFRRLGINRQIPAGAGGRTFVHTFGLLAAEATTMFNSLLEHNRPTLARFDDGASSPIDLLAFLANRIRRVHRLTDALRQLVREGRLTASFDRSVLTRLMRDGVLRRTQRGVYVVAVQFTAALAVLRQLERAWISALEVQ